MKFAYYSVITLMLGLSSIAEAQLLPIKNETPLSNTRSESQRVTKEINRRLKAVQPKRLMCLGGAHDKPFPEGLEQVFANTEVSVFAYPNTYTCDAPIGDKLVCDVDSDSLYFIRKGARGAKMSLLNEGKLKVLFGGPNGYECRKPRKSK